MPHDPAPARPDAGAGGGYGGLGPHRQQSGDPSLAAIASELAATEYGLNILMRGIEDVGDNTTRFVVLSADKHEAEAGDGPIVTTFIFRVRNVPAALYKALGGFATNSINMTKLESYQEGASPRPCSMPTSRGTRRTRPCDMRLTS